MATLYTQADSNIRKTWLYLSFFLILLIAVGFVISYYFNNPGILWFFVIFSLFLNFFSYWYSDKIILSISHAVPIEKKDNPELYRLVENLCITAGLPTPKIYIINEGQPNAFATGRDADHAALAVTKGLLDKLERSELEGVIGHELSHIGNKDLLLQTIIVVLVGVITTLTNIFFRMSFFGGRKSSNNEEGGQVAAIFAIVSIVLLILAPIAANLIKLAISRKREFLADADGALLTRYPEGLARALEKISQDPMPLRVASTSTAHLYVADPFRGKSADSWFIKLFSTHPPVEERIKILREMEI